MPDKFDPYREALVVEFQTEWPQDFEIESLAKRAEIEQQLHANPAACSELEYIRLHTGFCRQITVTQADIDRLTT